MTTTKELLQFARGRVSLPGSWCHGWTDGDAVCIVHALHMGMTTQDWHSDEPVFYGALELVAKEAGCSSNGPSLGWKNDVATQDEVIGWLDRAISKCDEIVTGT